MRLVTVFMVLLLASCASTGTMRAPEVLRGYDSIEGISYWTHTPIMLKNVGFDGSAAIFMQAGAVCEGDVSGPCDEPRYFLTFQAQGQRLTSSTDFTLRLGEERLRPEPINYEAGTGGITTFSEQLAYSIDGRSLERLARLPEGWVEGRLSGMTLNLSYERREALRLLADTLGL